MAAAGVPASDGGRRHTGYSDAGSCRGRFAFADPERRELEFNGIEGRNARHVIAEPSSKAEPPCLVQAVRLEQLGRGIDEP